MILARKHVLELNHVLKTTEFDLPIKARFRYALTSNIKTTDIEIEAINEAFPRPDVVNTYNAGERAIFDKYGVTSEDVYNKLEEETKLALDQEIAKYRGDNAAVIQEIREYETEKMGFLNEDVDISIKLVKVDDVPDISKNNKYNHWEIWNVLERMVIPED